MKKRYGRGDAGKGATRSESRDIREFFGTSPYKSNPDDRPARTPRDRNTGSRLSKKLAGKVIG
ncbi:hypothetical protein [Paraburkholderia kururiensis]|uniref:hypothetical protein n=1 Tax=Paraburkholderia kururiensis TaxID=984307 RepID=UPI000344EE45|nr:hypothetical protein [Paraburkholderia kururiensis]